MSIINKDCIYFECSIKETLSDRYEEAVAAELGEICRENWNYDGIGFEEEDLKAKVGKQTVEEKECRD